MMRARISMVALLALGVSLAAALAPAAAHAAPPADARARLALDLRSLPGRFQPAAADSDSSLEEYLDEMADTTGAYFGISAADRDTAGLDSSLAWHLENPEEDQPRTRPLKPGFGPMFAFNRVDGPIYSAGLWVGEPRLLGRLRGDLRYASGPNEWLGGGSYRKLVTGRAARWSLRLEGGRETASMDRDYPEWMLSSIRAFLTGHDLKSYFRRDGVMAWIERESETTRLGVGYRDMLERPLPITATWSVFKSGVKHEPNLAAARGRAREFGVTATARAPFVPVTVELSHQFSGPGNGSDFDYRRIRASASGDFGISDFAALIPQVFYGRLSGIAIPQQAFYLGGAHSLRSLSRNARAGTRMVVASLDLIGAFDVLQRAHIPHPAAFPLQLGAFATVGAAWGDDPFGGPRIPGDEWPRRDSWMSDAGLSLIYQPGIPDPSHFIRINYAFPLGPHRESVHWSASFSRAIDFVHPLGGGDD